MAKKSKITVKHFLNKNLKPVDGRYPVYMSIWFQNKLTKVKSNYWIFIGNEAEPADFLIEVAEVEYFSDKEFLALDDHTIVKALEREALAVEGIVRVFWERFQINIVYNSLGEIIDDCLRSVTDVASDSYKSMLQTRMAKIGNIKAVSARLLINWDTLSFINIYDGLEFISADSSLQTKFYTDILLKYETRYTFLKWLYGFDEKRQSKFRVWEWMKNEELFFVELKQHIGKKDKENIGVDLMVELNNLLRDCLMQSVRGPRES